MPYAKCGRTWKTQNNVNHRCVREKKPDGSPHDGDCYCPCGR